MDFDLLTLTGTETHYQSQGVACLVKWLNLDPVICTSTAKPDLSTGIPRRSSDQYLSEWVVYIRS